MSSHSPSIPLEIQGRKDAPEAVYCSIGVAVVVVTLWLRYLVVEALYCVYTMGRVSVCSASLSQVKFS